MKRQHVSGGTTWHRQFCTSPATTSSRWEIVSSFLERAGVTQHSFSAVLSGQLPVHLSDLLLWPRSSPDSSSPSGESQGWVAGDICRAVSPSEGTQDRRMAPVAQWYWHRPESAIHGGAVPSWEQAHGATLGTMKPATLAWHGRQKQRCNSLEQENTELCRKMGSLFFKQPL